VTVSLLVTGGNHDDIDQLIRTLRCRRRHVKVVKLPADMTDPGNPAVYQTLLLESVQNMSAARKRLLLLVPWYVTELSVND